MRLPFLCFVFTIFSSPCLFSQHGQTNTCGTDAYLEQQRQTQPGLAKKLADFETFYQSTLNGMEYLASGVDTLPIVVHIIHDGHPLGADENPDDATIIQKIADTNDRYRHINQVNGPNPFSNADTEIMFCLADEDANGNFTTGIIRHDDSLTFREPGIELINFIQANKWDTDKYLNIFFIRFVPDILGVYYGGSVDAVVLRSTTSDWLLAHEIGHYLSLWHTFQGACTNNDCLADGDQVCDTPPKAFAGISNSCGNPGNSCTTDDDDTSVNNPYRPVALGGLGDQPDLLQNYMDYTEGCGGSFTEGQKTRMKASIAAQRQSVVANAAVACGNNYTPATDAALVDLVTNDTLCQNAFLPEVKIRNNGTATLASAMLEFYVGGTLVHAQPWAGSLPTGTEAWATANTNLPITGGRKKLNVVLASPNGLADEFENDNAISRYVAFYGNGFPLPYSEALVEFFLPEHWMVENSAMAWTMNGYFVLDTCQSDNRLLAAVSGGQGMPHSATLELPPLDLSAFSGAQLSFDYGYLPYSAAFPDTFRIEALTACGTPVLLWEETGFGLATNDPPNYGNTYRYPECMDMDQVSIDLSTFGCDAQFSLRFTISGYGLTPLILDHIAVTSTTPCVPVGCTYLTNPLAGSATVPPNAMLTWAGLGAGYDGYLLDVGLTPGGAEILDGFDVGNVTTFDPPGFFPCDSTVYVKISPYTSSGPTVGCPEESFQTFSLLTCEPMFTENVIAPSFSGAFAVHTADMNLDGHMDVLCASNGSEIGWWEHDGNNNFTAHIIANDFLGGTSIYGMDMDGDMDMDILASARTSDQVAWWENDGSFNFTKNIIDGVFDGVEKAEPVDLDGDGDMDVTAVSWNLNDVVWYENDGGNVFTKHIIDGNFSTANGLHSIDVDADNKVDIIASSRLGGQLAWYKNNGNGTFSKNTVDADLDAAGSVNAADINGDGHMDILAISRAGMVMFYQNNGSNSFSKITVDGYFDDASDVFAQDIDLDGDLDIVASAAGSVNVAWYENNGTNVFAKTTILSGAGDIWRIFSSDINADGVADIVIPYNDENKIGWLNSGCVIRPATQLTNPVNGSPAEPVNTNLSWLAHPVAAGYFLAIGTAPGGEDILPLMDMGNVTTYDPPIDFPYSTTIYVTLMPYDGMGEIGSCTDEHFTTLAEGCTRLTSPLNGETGVGMGDTLHWIELGGDIIGYKLNVGLSTGGTELLDGYDVGAASEYHLPTLFPCDTTVYTTVIPYSAGEEFNGCQEESFQTFTTVIPPCEPTFLQQTIASSFDAPRAVHAGDLDGDGDTDLAGCSQSGNIAWWENDGSENFTQHVLDGNFGGGTSVQIVDLDGDNDLDILSVSRFANQIAWWKNNGGGGFTKQIIDGLFYEAQQAQAADVDGDGDLDVVGVSRSTNEINWYENDGNENFTKHFVDASLTGSMGISVADVNGDTHMDIVGAGEIVDEVAWYENDGNENFTKHAIDNSLDGAMHVQAADVDGDGNMDIVATAAVAKQVVWYENDGGANFTKHIIETNLNGATGVYADDIDLDGDMDIFGTSPSSTNLAWYENDGSENFTKNVLVASVSYVVSMSVADINGDGVRDILAPLYTTDQVVWLENSCEAAISTYLTSPVNAAVEVPQNTSIEWYAHPRASGYWLAIGTVPGGTDILAFQDMGNVSSFSPPSPLSSNTLVYVTLVPYDSEGVPQGCAEGFFTTVTCTPNLIVTGDPVPEGSYFSDGELLSQDATVAAATTVNFFSNNSVRLEGEFSVALGAVFVVEIQACPGD